MARVIEQNTAKIGRLYTMERLKNQNLELKIRKLQMKEES